MRRQNHFANSVQQLRLGWLAASSAACLSLVSGCHSARVAIRDDAPAARICLPNLTSYALADLPTVDLLSTDVELADVPRAGTPADESVRSQDQARPLAEGSRPESLDAFESQAAAIQLTSSTDVTPGDNSSEDLPTQMIDLTTALMLTGGQSPQVEVARWRIEEAQAQWERSEMFWLPSLRAGLNYNKHEGRIQDVAGHIIETSRGSMYGGFGASAVGAGSPAVPGLVAQFHFADAIFQPRIAEQTTQARRAGARAASNDALLETALAYITLVRAEQTHTLAMDTEHNAAELARVTGEFARTGQGLPADHDRAMTELALRKNETRRADEAVKVASARLCEQVRWDASTKLVPGERQPIPIEFVPPSTPSRTLVAAALMQRPEIAESRHLVCEAVERLEREKHAPLIPSVLLGLSYGGLAGGKGSNLTNFGDRMDADAVAYWEVRQLGLGERAIQREAESRIQQARWREIALLDRVAREVVEAHTQVQSRKGQIEIAKSAVQSARDSHSRQWERIQHSQGLPIEALQAIQALDAAQRDYIRAVAEYNAAQFTLQRSLGWPVEADREQH